MNQDVIRRRTYSRTPAAQQYRREHLEPEVIRAHLREWRDLGLGADAAAIGDIEMAQMLEVSDSAFAEYVRRILTVLAEVHEETEATTAEVGL